MGIFPQRAQTGLAFLHQILTEGSIPPQDPTLISRSTPNSVMSSVAYMEAEGMPIPVPNTETGIDLIP